MRATVRAVKTSEPNRVSGEFVALVALTTSLVAMSIDTMLPALGTMASELGATEANDRQAILTTFFLGLSIGQLLYGPISDTTGRKPALYAGMGLFVLGNAVCALSNDFGWLLLGRGLSGFGAAGPRTVAIALVRDRYEGPTMARVMSFVQSVFILVPMIAPSIGQGVLAVASWRAIFVGLVLVAALNLGWFAMRQAETLPPEQRVRFSARTILAGCKETFGNRLTLGYTLGSGFVFGAFIAYLSTSQQVFQEQYALGDKFPLLFGLLASGIGLASLLNGTLVVRFGIRRLSRMALVADCLLGAAGVLGSWLSDGRLPLELLIALLFGCFFCNGVLFGNFGARAMQPMGHIAGVAAAATNSASGLIALALGSAFGRAYDGTALPLVAGFTISGLLSLAITEWAERCPGASSVAASEGA